jgi:diacylglycerol kinase family enzyme
MHADPESHEHTGAAALPRTAATLPLAVVMNVHSGHLDSEQRRAQVEQALQASGRDWRLWPVEQGGGLQQAVDEAARWVGERGGALVAAGGDGTLNGVAQAAHAEGCPLGVLPQGTFNYFARSHGIPEELEESLAALMAARPRPVQVGQVNGRLFLVNASLGLYPQLLQDREAFKRQFGRYRINAALSALLTVLREHRRWTLTLELPGRAPTTVRSTTLFVGNNPLQLQQLGLPQAGRVGHGVLGVVMVKSVGRLGLLALAARGALGKLAQADAAVDFAARTLSVRAVGRSHAPVKVAVDGEILRLQPPLRFEVALRPLHLLLPPGVDSVVAKDAA